jgi:hypothetical protein
MSRVLVCGGRSFNDEARLFAVLDSYDNERDFTVLIEGAARGADTLARKWAEAKKIPVLPFPADWKRHGRAAGPIRNERMLREGKPDLVIAFPGGKGTAHMVSLARHAGVETIEVRP